MDGYCPKVVVYGAKDDSGHGEAWPPRTLMHSSGAELYLQLSLGTLTDSLRSSRAFTSSETSASKRFGSCSWLAARDNSSQVWFSAVICFVSTQYANSMSQFRSLYGYGSCKRRSKSAEHANPRLNNDLARLACWSGSPWAVWSGNFVPTERWSYLNPCRNANQTQ